MNIFYDFLDSNKNYDRLRDSIKENKTPVLATGVVDGQKTHLIAGITNDVFRCCRRSENSFDCRNNK